MMLLDTLKLLTYSPTHALLLLANESLGTSLNPSNVEVVAVTGLTGVATEVTLRAQETGQRPINPSFIANPYEGQTKFLFNRLNLTEVFGAAFALDLYAPTTVTDVLNRITAKTGILFDEHDFAQDRIMNSAFTLSALPSSRRWVGEVNFILNE